LPFGGRPRGRRGRRPVDLRLRVCPRCDCGGADRIGCSHLKSVGTGGSEMPPQGSARSTRTLATRYAPFLAIVALQLVLVTITPKNSTQTVQQGGVEAGAAGEQGVGNATASGSADQGAATATPGAAAQSNATGTGGSTGSGAAAPGGSTGGATSKAGAAGGTTNATGGGASQVASNQPVDPPGRPTAGA